MVAVKVTEEVWQLEALDCVKVIEVAWPIAVNPKKTTKTNERNEVKHKEN